jgi:hypothetical protein
MNPLERALACIESMKENKTWRGQYKIGEVVMPIGGSCGQMYKVGDVILFEDDGDGRITVETPYTQEEIGRQRAKGSLLTTGGTIVNVPAVYVQEIPLKEEKETLPDFDPDVSPKNPQNIRAANARGLRYDRRGRVYRDESGCPTRDRFGQPLG